MGSLKVGPEIFAVDFACGPLPFGESFRHGAIRLPSAAQCTTGSISPAGNGHLYSRPPKASSYIPVEKGRYGRIVEVDHGNGLRTRYAHLLRSTVKKGQKIGHRHKIGLLGSTGRSTGPHVHYEILFNGKQIDPFKFIKAGRYVFKEPKADVTKGKARKKRRLSQRFRRLSALIFIFLAI